MGAELPADLDTVELDEREVARRTGMRVAVVERMIRDGGLPARQASSGERAATGTRWRIRLSAVQNLSRARSMHAARGRRGRPERQRDGRER